MDCKVCFVRGCECPCKTCRDAERQRQESAETPRQTLAKALGAALAAGAPRKEG